MEPVSNAGNFGGGDVNLGDVKSIKCVFPEGTYFDTASIAAADLIDDIVVPADGVLRASIYISGLVAAKLSATITRSTKVTVYFNGNTDLTVSTLYTFDMPVRKGDVVNYQLDDAVPIEVLNVDFIRQQGP